MEIIQIQKRCQVEKINYEARKSALFKVELKFAYGKIPEKRCCYKQIKGIFACPWILSAPASNFVYHRQISVFIFLVRVFGCLESGCVLCLTSVYH